MRDLNRQAVKDRGAKRKADKVARAHKHPKARRPLRELCWTD